MTRKTNQVLIMTFVLLFANIVISGAQEPDISFEKMVKLTLSNRADIPRKSEFVSLNIEKIKQHIPDFNRHSFRLRDPDAQFEPADIPWQTRMMPGEGEAGDDLLFQLDFAPGETRKIEIWYNPDGNDHLDFPPKTQASDTWYRPSTTLVWENQDIIYRSYSGIVDFFGKTYPHLRIGDLMNDSYHHEQIWGVDPYLVGEKPGIGGILLVDGEKTIQCYGAGKESERSYQMLAFDGGPVSAGGVVRVMEGGEQLLNVSYEIFTDHFENLVHASLANNSTGILIAPGIQKNDNSELLIDQEKGYLAVWGSPVRDYGTIGTALVWNPEDAEDLIHTDMGVYIKLRPDSEGEVSYRSLAIWHRATAPQPECPAAFAHYLSDIASRHKTPVIVAFE